MATSRVRPMIDGAINAQRKRAKCELVHLILVVNMDKVIVNRCDGSASASAVSRDGPAPRRDPNAFLVASLASKIEDGNSVTGCN